MHSYIQIFTNLIAKERQSVDFKILNWSESFFYSGSAKLFIQHILFFLERILHNFLTELPSWELAGKLIRVISINMNRSFEMFLLSSCCHYSDVF